MNLQEDHLTTETLSRWESLPFTSQMGPAHHLSVACDECWSVVNSTAPTQPLSHSDPFLRTLARVRHLPKVDLSLPSQALRLLANPPFLRSDFPLLLLQESIALAFDSPDPDRVASLPGLPAAVAEMLKDDSETQKQGTGLKVNVQCAAVHFYLLADDLRSATEALNQAGELYVRQTCELSTAINLRLASFMLACRGSRSKAMSIMNDITDKDFPSIMSDPIRRFEISCQLVQGLKRVGGTGDEREAISWALSQLDLGSWEHEIHRLSGLVCKARVASAIPTLQACLPHTVAAELEGALESVERHGDEFSLGLFHQLIGELRQDDSSFDVAFAIYSDLGLERPFQEAWLAQERMAGDPAGRPQLRDKTHQKALKNFGRDAADRMLRIVSGILYETKGALA